MKLVLSLLVCVPLAVPARSADTQALVEEALKLAQSVPDAAQRSDAVGRVAAEIAKTDPKRALQLVADQMATHEQSEAMARAAETLAAGNRLLGLATLIRVPDRSGALVAIERIIAMEALSDLDEAANLTDKIDSLTVRRQTEREVSRIVWDELPGDRDAALDVAVKWAERVSDPATRAEALAYAAQGIARYQGAGAAAPVAAGISDRETRDLAWRLVVQEIAAKDTTDALALLGRIETPFQRNLAAVSVVAGLAAAGKSAEALKLAGETRDAVIAKLEDPRDQGLILGELAMALGPLDLSRALSILSEVWPPVRQYALQCRLARVAAERDPEQARELLNDAWVELRRMDAPLLEDDVAAQALATAAVLGRPTVDSLAKEQPAVVQRALLQAVLVLAADKPELALELSGRLTEPAAVEQAKVALAEALAATRPDLARSIGEAITSPAGKSRVLLALAASLARS
jgi:hypothetical protein